MFATRILGVPVWLMRRIDSGQTDGKRDRFRPRSPKWWSSRNKGFQRRELHGPLRPPRRESLPSRGDSHDPRPHGTRPAGRIQRQEDSPGDRNVGRGSRRSSQGCWRPVHRRQLRSRPRSRNDNRSHWDNPDGDRCIARRRLCARQSRRTFKGLSKPPPPRTLPWIRQKKNRLIQGKNKAE